MLFRLVTTALALCPKGDRDEALAMTRAYIGDVAATCRQSVRQVLRTMGLTSAETQQLFEVSTDEEEEEEEQQQQQPDEPTVVEEEGVSAEGRTEEPQPEVEASRAGEGDEETGIADSKREAKRRREREEREEEMAALRTGIATLEALLAQKIARYGELQDEDLLDYCDG
ncbi:uncharacterized protein LOC127751120 isoform X2 [Frankliniella occidentalis]|uniref:Uncharacterized protein LOC127751120 isoform X2 n=1 Tax=Frankliniella occidentalis TaxID=133901 RepID=A0A9C6X6W6_FRAOC|nr:uncharacterized protein LOC127751120 isoform X2 [Frankliniella occidentalis]